VLRFLLRRLLSIPVVMLAVTLLIVALMQLIPPESRAASYITNARQLSQLPMIVKEKGLDRPFHVQYLSWLREVFQGNLGYSKASNEPVLKTIRKRLPASLELAFYSGLIVIGLGLWLGTNAALRRGKFFDRASSFLAVSLYSLPAFVLGVWLLVIFYGGLNIVPGIGRLSQSNEILLITGAVKSYTGLLTIDALLSGQWKVFLDALAHLVLPVITLSATSVAVIIKAMRSSLLDTLSSDYVRTAKAKGLSARAVNLKHARRNALLPVTTLATIVVLGLLGGSVITESIFAYPGIGSWVAKAAVTLDYAGVLGFALLASIIVVLANFLVDVLYSLLDPRVSV
jgi:ABC-type dipeptide/oligopeptide/nickel transport system permease component